MAKKTISVLLTLLLLISCCTAGLSALAADDARLQEIYQTLNNARPDKTDEDHNYDDCIALVKDLSAEELVALGKQEPVPGEDAFWWAGNRLLEINRSFSYDRTAEALRQYCPSVYLDIAQKVPAYADFIRLLLDGVTAYSFLIGEPTKTDIALSEEERTPIAIGKRIAALPEEQIAALKSSRYFSNMDCFAIEGITENLSEEKAQDESIGAIKTETTFDFLPGFVLTDWETAYFSENILCNFSLCAAFFEKTYADAGPSLAALENFAAVIEGLKAPYRTADLETAKAAFAAVPTTAWTLADERAGEARNKYRTILAANRLEDNAVDLSAYKRTDLGKNELSDKSVSQLKELLGSAVNLDEELRNAIDKIATGSTLVSLLGSLAGANDMLSALFSIEFVASGLAKDPKFAGAVKIMETLQEEGHDEGFFEYCPDEEGFKIVTWSAADRFTSADFGFKDGDFYGFADALSACFSNLSGILSLVSGFSFRNIADGDNYIIGKYEELIPLFELLELQPLSSAEFSKAENALTFTDTEGNVYTDQVRAGFICLLKPLADFLMTTFKNAPLETALDLLPKAAFAIESGLLNNSVEKLLGPFASLGFAVDLSKNAIWNIVDQKLVTPQVETSIDGTKTRLTDVGIDLDKNGDKEAVPLTKDRFDRLVTDLAGCAEPEVKNSVSIPNANRMGLNTRKNKVVSVLVREVLEMEKTAEGKAFLDLALDSAGAPSLVKSLLNFAAKRGADFTFKLLDRFLPIIMIVMSVMNFFQKIKSLFCR